LNDKELGRRWLHLACDAEYDPSNCFHLELRFEKLIFFLIIFVLINVFFISWNACPGYLVKDFVQGNYLFCFIFEKINFFFVL